VQFYELDDTLTDDLSRFVGSALGAGDYALVIATPAHRASLVDCLDSRGIDVGRAVEEGRLVALDAAEILELIMHDGYVDADRFAGLIGPLVDRGASSSSKSRVVAFGEMVALLWDAGNIAAALRLEALWNNLGQTHNFDLLCAYPMRLFARESDGSCLELICDAHSEVIPAESYSALDAESRLRAIALLQQKAQALESEIEERARVETALQRREAELEDALAARDEFLTVAAHELKTPLTGLRLTTQVLQRRFKEGPVETSNLEQFIERLDRQTRKLTFLVEQLLDISRLKREHLTLQISKVDLAGLVVSAIETLVPSGERQILLPADQGSLWAEVDEFRIEQVVANLIDNAMKYSPHGGPIEVGLDLVDEAWARISVRDYGMGIPADALERVFEPFFRVPHSDAPPGNGLGLHICHQIVELHGGSIHCEQAEGCGTRFIITVPLRQPVSHSDLLIA
jgi:signal transduction histidine kinase